MVRTSRTNRKSWTCGDNYCPPQILAAHRFIASRLPSKTYCSYASYLDLSLQDLFFTLSEYREIVCLSKGTLHQQEMWSSFGQTKKAICSFETRHKKSFLHYAVFRQILHHFQNATLAENLIKEKKTNCFQGVPPLRIAALFRHQEASSLLF